MKNNAFENALFIKAEATPSPFLIYDPLPRFRREISIKREISHAVLRVQSPGFASYFINGKSVTEDKFISPVSNYSKILWYNSYDVTDLLKEGQNCFTVIAGNGFLNEPFKTPWSYDESPWRDAPQFMLSLEVDGEVILVSDGEWRARRDGSPIIYSHLRSGEYYDARLDSRDWMAVGFDDTGWQRALTKPLPDGARLIETPCQPVRECERIAPVSIRKTSHGYLVDFGVNISGYIEFSARLTRGAEVTFTYAEEINSLDRPNHEIFNLGYFYPESPFHKDKLIASGELDTFKPRFAYHGFRYVEIEGLTDESDIESICAYFVHQDVKQRATFHSGDPLLNFIYDAGIRSSLSNLFWSVTDCPTREKLGWANDAAASAGQMLINLDILPLYKKWFTDLLSDMRNNGSLPGIIPSNGWGDNWGPVCDNLLFELPYRIYVYTADPSMLTEAIPYFDRYLTFLREACEKEHEFILGDWLGDGGENSPLTPKRLVRDTLLLKAERIAALAKELAGVSRDENDAAAKKLSERLKAEYLDGDGYSKVASQTALAILIRSGIYSDLWKLKKQLSETVQRDGFKLTCGMVGIQYIYDALSDTGMPEYAYKLITESEPGYKSWYQAGATTLWENWDGATHGSHNHHMFSNVLEWFHRTLLGIAPTEDSPGYSSLELKPSFIEDVGYCEGSVETPFGVIRAKWQYTDGGFIYEVDLPSGIDASFQGKKLPNGLSSFVLPV